MNLFGILEQLDRNDPEVHEKLQDNPEDLTELEKNLGWLIPQWLTGASSEPDHKELILRFEAIANPVWTMVHKHPKLAAKLLAQVGTGRKVRHKFYRPSGSRKKANGILALLRRDYPDLRENEARIWCRENDPDTFHRYLDSHAIPNGDRKKLKEEYEWFRK